MMKGYLITNHFLKSDKFSSLQKHLEGSAKKAGINLESLTNAQLLALLPLSIEGCKSFFGENGVSFVLFWDKDIRLARFIEECGVRVFNPSHAIESCDDKSLTYIRLLEQGVPMPKTVISPKTFFPSALPEEFILSLEERLSFPMVIKECYGSFGRQVYLAQSREELEELCIKLSPSPLVFQEYISSSAGRDYRLNVVGNKVVCAMERRNDNDFRANISNGGYMLAHTPTKEQEELALRVCRALDLDFAGVDLLTGKNGESLVCEVNSNAHFINILNCTGVDVADFIMEHIKKEASV